MYMRKRPRREEYTTTSITKPNPFPVITKSAQTCQAYVCQLDATVVAEQGTVRV